MSQYILPALVNGIAVTAGLFVLWSVVGGMRQLSAGDRFRWALVAGAVSTVLTFVVSLWLSGGPT